MRNAQEKVSNSEFVRQVKLDFPTVATVRISPYFAWERIQELCDRLDQANKHKCKCLDKQPTKRERTLGFDDHVLDGTCGC